MRNNNPGQLSKTQIKLFEKYPEMFQKAYARSPLTTGYEEYLNSLEKSEKFKVQQCAYAKELADKLTKPLGEHMSWTDFHDKKWTLGEVLKEEKEKKEEEERTYFLSFLPSISHKSDILIILEEIQKNKPDNNTIREKIHKKYPKEISDALTRAVIATLVLEKLQKENFRATGGEILENGISEHLATKIWSQKNPYDTEIQKLKEQAAQEAAEAFKAPNNPTLQESAPAPNNPTLQESAPAPEQPSIIARFFASITSFFTQIYNYFAQSKTPEATSDRESLLGKTFNPLPQENLHHPTQTEKKPQVPQKAGRPPSGAENNKKLF